jgi:hypothetical protein
MKARMAHLRSGTVAHTFSCAEDTGSFQTVNQPGRGVNRSRQFLAEVKERVTLYLYFSSVPSWQLVGFLFN